MKNSGILEASTSLQDEDTVRDQERNSRVQLARFLFKAELQPQVRPLDKDQEAEGQSPEGGAQGLCDQQSALRLHASQIFWAFFDLSPLLQGRGSPKH